MASCPTPPPPSCRLDTKHIPGHDTSTRVLEGPDSLGLRLRDIPKCVFGQPNTSGVWCWGSCAGNCKRSMRLCRQRLPHQAPAEQIRSVRLGNIADMAPAKLCTKLRIGTGHPAKGQWTSPESLQTVPWQGLTQHTMKEGMQPFGL